MVTVFKLRPLGRNCRKLKFSLLKAETGKKELFSRSAEVFYESIEIVLFIQFKFNQNLLHVANLFEFFVAFL